MPRKVLLSFLFGGPAHLTWPAEVGLFILRVWSGLALALLHGLGKIRAPEDFIAGVQDRGFPVPTLTGWMAIFGEFVGGILLALGLFTRPAGLWIMGVMAGAAFVVHRASFSGEADLVKAEPALMFMAAGLCFLLTGSSRTGLDQIFWRRWHLSGEEAKLASFERRRAALEAATRR